MTAAVTLESDDLDEIDLEFVGSNTTHAENNYYGKGNTTDEAARAKWYPVGASPMDAFHNYTTRWTNESLEWYIDGNVVRTLAYADANGGKSYPQTPMNVRIGIWAGGDKKNNNYTIQWAGGEIDYTKVRSHIVFMKYRTKITNPQTGPLHNVRPKSTRNRLLHRLLLHLRGRNRFLPKHQDRRRQLHNRQHPRPTSPQIPQAKMVGPVARRQDRNLRLDRGVHRSYLGGVDAVLREE